MEKNIFALDIGGSKMLCAIVTENGKILNKLRYDFNGAVKIDYVLNCIKEAFNILSAKDCICVSAAIPGLANPITGEWVYSPFSGISNVHIVTELEKITGLKVYIDNDVNVCAIAEKYFGVCKDKNDYLWITVSNGIGGGLVLNGDLYYGANLSAGEIGHFIVEENTDKICGCGNRGCLEIMASGSAIIRRYFELTGKKYSGKEIADAVRANDEIASFVYRESGMYIGKAIANAVNLLGLDCVVIGGGVSQSFDLIEPAIREGVEKYVFHMANPNIRIVKTGLDYYAALIGCVALVKYKENKNNEKNNRRI